MKYFVSPIVRRGATLALFAASLPFQEHYEFQSLKGAGLLPSRVEPFGDVHGELTMRGSPTPLTFDPSVDADDLPLREAVRMLVEMAESCAGGTEISNENENLEVILADVEVDGARYLVVRMPKLNRARVLLSPREQEIGRMVAKGHPNKVIADVLNISSWTVCTHMRRMFAKLGVGTRAAMVARLLEIGVIGPDHRVPADVRSFEVSNRTSRT